MSVEALSLEDTDAPGVVRLNRSSVGIISTVLRDPLRGLPPAVYEQKLAVGQNFGRMRAYVSDPILIQKALVRTSEALHKGIEMNRVLSPALGAGLLTADGPHWRWQRQTIAPTFQPDKLAAFLPAMIASANATRDRWQALPAGATLDISREMMRTTFVIIAETMLSGRGSLDTDRVESSVTDYLDSTTWRFALALLRAPHWLPFPGRRRAAVASRFLRSAIQEMIAGRRAKADHQNDLVALLIAASDPESGRTMTDSEITDNILTFIGAGHETTAVALSWTFMLLANHADCLDRLLEEVERITGGGPVEPQHVAQMTYTRQVISEGMRLYPPAPLISRTVIEDLELKGVTLPAGSILIVPIYAVHRHRALWENPERFDPDRFTPAAIKARHRYAYMPFGAGPRVCIGSAFALMEAVAILAILTRAFRLDRAKPNLPDPMTRITLRPTKPLEMRVAARH